MSACITADKPQRKTSAAYSLAYASALPVLQQVARDHGYALAVHGSMQTDFDLIAVPWIEQPKEPATLIEAIREAIDGVITHPPEENEKPHGRLAWTMVPGYMVANWNGLDYLPWLDISVMPPR